MFVLCILFVFVLCIVSNVYSCPFLVVPSVFNVCVVYFVCLRSVYCNEEKQIHNTNIENWRDNQEWAAVSIGYNTQNEEKQNTQHKHRKPTGQPGMGSCKHSRRFSMFVLCILFFFVLWIVSNVYSCPFLVVPSVFYVCVMYFVFLRSEWAAVNIGYNSQNEEKQNTQHKHRKLTGQPGMGSCKHWIQYRRFSMFVLCILFVFVLWIVSNVYSCPFLVVPSVFYACVLYFACLRSVYCITRNGQL
jgi:Flp pilus assembly protein TadB